MTRIIHLSDLHFGRARPELLEPLVAAVNGLAPDLVAISGDLTQRARRGQFKQARDFIDRLEPPVLCVPGNHDVPLENLAVRLVAPFMAYRRYVSVVLEPVFEAEGTTVVGLNTVNPYVWQSGKVGQRAVERACAVFEGRDDTVRIVVAHHPFEHGPDVEKKPMRGAAGAIDRLADCGADIVLTGHLHTWMAEPFAERPGRRGAVQVHAGTGLSTRVRGEENDFNLLTVRDRRLLVERYAAAADAQDFTKVGEAHFDLHGHETAGEAADAGGDAGMA